MMEPGDLFIMRWTLYPPAEHDYMYLALSIIDRTIEERLRDAIVAQKLIVQNLTTGELEELCIYPSDYDEKIVEIVQKRDVAYTNR